jgi:two-component system, sensor histidine kinase and response regulator
VKPESKDPLASQESRADDVHAVDAQRLKAALEASNIGFWDWDLATGDVFVDRTFFRFLGQDKPEQVLNVEELARLVHRGDGHAFSVAMDDTRLGRTPLFHSVYRAQHADGRWVWIETCGNITERDAHGRAVRMSGTHADVTDRKQTETALSNTLRMMQVLLETLPLPVIIRDAQRRVTMVNAAWEQMMGVSREEIAGNTLASVPNRPPTKGHSESDDQVVESRKPLRYETSVTARDETVYNVIVAKTPLLAEDGTVVGIASVVTDISEQKRTAAVLERARLSAEAAVLAKSRFLANMSHELRTPLNGVVGMASLLENTPLDAKQRRFVRTLRSSAEALITLINDVLDLSKAEAGKMELSITSFDLRRELEQVVSLFSGRAHDKGVEIAAHIGRDVPATMRGDPIRLRQVLGNLVNNAVKFTDTGAVLLGVAVMPRADAELWLEFSVTDTGMGVAPEEQKRIFDAFEQADGSVTRKFGGTGLGLAISRQLVDLMDGTISLTSEAGHGSRFSVAISAGVPRVATVAAKPAANSTCLVIGMHPVIRRAICEIVAAESAQVIDAATLAEALAAMKKLAPQVTRIRAVVDAVAGSLAPAVSALRGAAGTRQVEVIALLPPDADVAPIAGITRMLIKPLCTPDLIAPLAAPESGQTLSVRALPAAGSRGRALVVEDNLVNQEMARTMLDMLGFQVSTASNGHEGVQAAAADPDLAIILMDCQMPVMDGLAAVRAIRAAEPKGKHIPIVALTGNAMPGDREACIAAGMDDYLAKPFSLTALRAVLDQWAAPQPLSAHGPAAAHLPR